MPPPLEKTLAYARRAMELGASSLGLGDSAGMADPIHTERILRGILERFRPEQISLHIHNTEGFGLANCVKAMELGFTRFDVSLAGMGGCPVIPNAKGTFPPKISSICSTKWTSTAALIWIAAPWPLWT